ncbi:hypothetical protein [Roseomonas sp. USHLN139]|uniref:hypothetical protein n=1 Tax=Roseomonas sp. USHLN139 TaxID=3081298 RepID=UPI003B02D58D
MALRLVPHLGTVNGNYRAELPGQIAATAPAKPMVWHEFNAALRVIRWTPTEVAERLNLAPSTVRRLASGHGKIPEDISAWLRAYAADVAAAQERHPPPRRTGRPGP